MLSCKLIHALDQPQLVVHRNWLVTLGRAVLAEHPAGPSLRHMEALHQVLYRLPTSRRAHHFDFCRSLSIEISNTWSAMIRFSRPFSSSSAFSR
jgi:hypothetical protein